MGVLELFLAFGAIAAWLYWWCTKTFTYWESRGVSTVKPVPLFGNSWEMLTGKLANAEFHSKLYKELKDHPYAGIYVLRKPVFYAHRPELVEAILIKDFSHFYNRGLGADEKLDPYSSHLVNLENEKWKNLRNKLTPVFSSGKLRLMEEKLINCVDDLVAYIKMRKDEPLNAKEVMARLTTDVIGATAFGLQMETMNDPNSHFRRFGKEVFRETWLERIRLFARINFPRLLRILRWRHISNESQNFFSSVVKDTVKQREEMKAEGKDFLQLLINLRKQDKTSQSSIVNNCEEPATDSKFILNDQMLISNAFVFFSAGFETTATTLSYSLFELSIHQDIQDKLYKDLKEGLGGNGSQLTYDKIKNIPYLEQLIYETLRKWPPVVSTTRVCNKEYTIPGTNIVIKKGQRVIVPIYPIHHDERYWPEPEKFNPDRFAPENKGKIVKGSFLPFGEGPRICIGMRFAVYEIEIALAKILTSFKLKLNQKTKVPFGFKKTATFLVPDTQLMIDFQER